NQGDTSPVKPPDFSISMINEAKIMLSEEPARGSMQFWYL
ncbi:23437_t:CDS:1, partial [Dentiscutata erythropus]